MRPTTRPLTLVEHAALKAGVSALRTGAVVESTTLGKLDDAFAQLGLPAGAIATRGGQLAKHATALEALHGHLTAHGVFLCPPSRAHDHATTDDGPRVRR